MLEFLLQLLIEIVGQIIFEGLTALGWEALKDSTRPERETMPALAAVGHFLMGVFAGVLSLFIIGRRLAPHSPLPGISLVLSPIGTGIAMHWIGEFWRERGRDRPAMFSFRAGAIFAFGMALVRFLYLELGWRLF
jgi:hypothetical protein